MAGNADISLVFGVATSKGDGGDSTELIRGQLEAITKELNSSTKGRELTFGVDAAKSKKEIKAEIGLVIAAINGERHLTGRKLSFGVDSSTTKANIKKDLSTIVGEINGEKNLSGRKITFDVDYQQTKDNIKNKLNTMFTDAKTGQSMAIKVDTIDASGAIAKLKTDIQNALSSFNVGVMTPNIAVSSGVTTNIDSSSLNGVSTSAQKASLSVAELNARLKEIDSTNKAIKSSYEAYQKALSGSFEDLDSERVKKVRESYVDLQTQVEQLRLSKASATQEEITNIYKTQTALQKLISIESDYVKSVVTGNQVVDTSYEGSLRAIQTLEAGIHSAMKQDFKSVLGAEELSQMDTLYQSLCVSLEKHKALQGEASVSNVKSIMSELEAFQTLLRHKTEAVTTLKNLEKTQSGLGTSISSLDSSVDAKGLAEIEAKYKSITTAIDNAKSSKVEDAAESLKSAVTQQQVLQDLITKYQELTIAAKTTSEAAAQFATLQSIQSKLVSDFKSIQSALKFEGSAEGIQKASAAMTELNQVFATLSTKNKIDVVDLEGLNAAQAKLRTAIIDVQNFESSAKKSASAIASQFSAIDSALIKVGGNIELLSAKFNSADDVTNFSKMKESLTSLTSEMERLRSGSGVIDNSYLQSIAILKERTAELAAATKGYVSEEEKKNNATRETNKLLAEAYALQRKLSSALTNYSKAVGTPEYVSITKMREEIDRLIANTNELDKNSLTNIRNAFSECESDIRAAGNASKSFGAALGENIKKFSAWLGVSQGVMYVVRYFKNMVSAVVELDTAMTELRRVTSETETTYTRFLDNAATRAKTLGASLADTVQATADFSRLGYSLDDASMLADSALVYKNVGDGIDNITDASASLISTMQAFKIEAADAMFTVDKFNEVGNNFAITSEGVGAALLNSASALAAGNNSLDESIALITTANTVVQDAEKVGTTLKTVSMYLRAAKTEAEEAGESTDGMAESVSELRGELLALTGGKVDIQIDNDTFKSTYEIIGELSKVWGELTDISQANILEMIGGKRNSNVVSALIEGFDIAEDVVETAANAMGSALEENEQYLDSIAGKLDILSATFQDFSQKAIESEHIKFILDMATALMEVAVVLADLGLLWPLFYGGIAAFTSLTPIATIAAITTGCWTLYEWLVKIHVSNEDLINDAADLKNAYASTMNTIEGG